jgi:hypothetical protein
MEGNKNTPNDDLSFSWEHVTDSPRGPYVNDVSLALLYANEVTNSLVTIFMTHLFAAYTVNFQWSALPFANPKDFNFGGLSIIL